MCVKIVVLTVQPLKDFSKFTSQAQMDDYLVKPISSAELITAVGAQAMPLEGPIQLVHVPEDLADLVEIFLARSRGNAQQIETLLQEGSFDEIARIGHNFAGSGGSFGFTEISRLGQDISVAARECEVRRLKASAQELVAYLHKVRWEPVG